MPNTPRAVFYIERQQIQISIENREDIISYPVPENLLSNIEILDREELEKNIVTFLREKNCIFGNAISVLSESILFEKDFKAEESGLEQIFLDNIPFEESSIQRILLPTGQKVVVANSQLIETLSKAVEQIGGCIEMTIPEIALGAPISQFNVATARLILTRQDAFKSYAFALNIRVPENINPSAANPEKKPKSSLIYILPIFVVLLLILFFIILKPYLFKAPAPAALVPTLMPIATIAPTINLSPIISAPVENTATSSAIQEDLKARIIFDISMTDKAEQLRGTFSSINIKDIEMNSTSIITQKPRIAFYTSLNANIRSIIMESINKTYPDIVVEELTEPTFAFTITLGRPS
jgi:hypothetical protein